MKRENILRRVVGGQYFPDAHDYIDALSERISWPPCLLCGERCPSQREFCKINEAFLLCSACDPNLVEPEDWNEDWDRKAKLVNKRMRDWDCDVIKLFYIDEEYFR